MCGAEPSGRIVADRSSPSDWEIFKIEIPNNRWHPRQFVIRTCHGNYLTNKNGIPGTAGHDHGGASFKIIPY